MLRRESLKLPFFRTTTNTLIFTLTSSSGDVDIRGEAFLLSDDPNLARPRQHYSAGA
jgi:hypothetical protein